ncbi:phage holin family protein [Enterobacteriaceae bacterium LUAb1]
MPVTDKQHGPAQGAIQTGKRILTILVNMAETRLRLAALEIDEEKNRLLHIVMLAGLTMLFTAFGLMSLLLLIVWAVDVQYRLIVISVTTGVLFALALVSGLWAMRKSRHSSLLSLTRKELRRDRQLLEEEP